MKKYRIPFKVTCTVYVEIEAENKDDAIDQGYQEVYLSSYAGNGGNGDKLMGVYGSNISCEPGEDFEAIEDCIEEIN